MKILYTDAGLKDLTEIADWLAGHYPAIAPIVERRIREVVARIGRWPESARRSGKRPGVRVVPVGRYPYKIFYLAKPIKQPLGRTMGFASLNPSYWAPHLFAVILRCAP
jgi:toxin ParE1/3/4